MKLKIYEIDAIVSEIEDKITAYNNSLNIPNEEDVKSDLEKNDPIILGIKNLVNKLEEIENELEKICHDFQIKGNYYTGKEINVINKIIDKKMTEIKNFVGFKTINKQEIKKLVILNSNKDLEEIINIISKKFGI